jgi:hypothetical protein
MPPQQPLPAADMAQQDYAQWLTPCTQRQQLNKLPKADHTCFCPFANSSSLLKATLIVLRDRVPAQGCATFLTAPNTRSLDVFSVGNNTQHDRMVRLAGT